MKRIMAAGCCVLLLCMSAGCAENAAEPEQDAQNAGLNVQASEDMDAAYTECIKSYFEAIEHKDYDAYRAAVYPPYLEAYGAFLEKKGSTSENAFDELCRQFDEDGYESWTLTDLTLSYYPEEQVDLDNFFERYESAGVFDADFADQCRKDAEEIRDVQFSLYALYQGDEEAVPVVKGSELIVVRNADGVFLFG